MGFLIFMLWLMTALYVFSLIVISSKTNTTAVRRYTPGFVAVNSIFAIVFGVTTALAAILLAQFS